VKGHVPDPALVPYSVNSPLWSDGAHKERFIALPGDTRIDYANTRGWNFPEGAVLVKTFALDLEHGNPATRKRIETRLLTKTQGQWYGYTYEWNDQQTEATLVASAGVDRDFTIADPTAPGGVRKQTWHYPSRAECMVCHTRAANFVLGLSTLQMNREHEYADGVRENQLRVLERLGVLNNDYISHARDAVKRDLVRQGKSGKEADELAAQRISPAGQRKAGPSTLLNVPPERLPSMPDPYDATAELDKRARAYLHANCAICHVEAGGGNSQLDLEFTTAPAKMKVLDVRPQHDAFGIEDARIVAPGDPARSALLERLTRRGGGQMPPLASSLQDAEALKLIREWIAKMPPPGAKPAP
jgi:mono/diheme cytochrome c family protein